MKKRVKSFFANSTDTSSDGFLTMQFSNGNTFFTISVNDILTYNKHKLLVNNILKQGETTRVYVYTCR